MRTRTKLLVPALLTIVLNSAVANGSAAATAVTPDEARVIAKEATIYGFPLVDNYRIQYAYFVDRSSKEYKAPWNHLHNDARVYTPEDRAVQTPNSDTPYSQLGADLRGEPLVITVPAIEEGRYYSLQFIDMYCFNFAYVGSRATGNGPGSYLLAGPRWRGTKPRGIKSVIRSETDFAFVLYRTQLFGPEDIGNVRKVQAGYRVQTLSEFLGGSAPPAPPRIEFPRPLSAVDQRVSPEFFRLLDFVLQFCPTHSSERQLRARFAKLGIGTGRFDVSTLAPETRKAMQAGMADAWSTFQTFQEQELATGRVGTGEILGSRAFLKNNYLYRMAAAALGIYGNSREEALYPPYVVDSSGRKLNGANRYTLRFAPGELPPVNSFWSLTMYEMPASLLYANRLNRYLINSPMLPSLRRDADGGLTLIIQHDSPGKAKESNWLPAPSGPFQMAMRLYWPKPEALDGRWKAPPLRVVGAEAAPAAEVGGIDPVTVDNFTRAETDMYFASTVKRYGIGKLGHNRDVVAIDEQTVIRPNRDTIYSSGVFDLQGGPVTITMPDAGTRFMSLIALDEDHYVRDVAYGRGKRTYTRERIGTRYVMLAVRTLVNPNDRNDMRAARGLQDAIRVEQRSRGDLDVPNWDPESQKQIREALLELATTVPDTKGMFGSRDDVDPVRHLIGTAMGWGGNPEKDAFYLNVTPRRNDGRTVHRLTAKNVPVDAFWSISVYGADGYFHRNQWNAYSLNNLTAKADPGGSVTVQFGGCDGKTPNCLPITPGWNYLVRLYRPRKEILDGTWKFPEAAPVAARAGR